MLECSVTLRAKSCFNISIKSFKEAHKLFHSNAPRLTCNYHSQHHKPAITIKDNGVVLDRLVLFIHLLFVLCTGFHYFSCGYSFGSIYIFMAQFCVGI